MNAAPPMVQCPLSQFLGLYTEASPEDLPEGVSPRNWDVDFVIGSVTMRPGKQNAYSFAGASIGPNLATLGENAAGDQIAWANPTGITIPGQFAFVAPLTGGTPSAYAGTAADLGGPSGWNNPNNAVGSGGGFASNTTFFPSTANGISNYLFLSGYGFAALNVPPEAVINGIQVTIHGFQASGNVLAALSVGGSTIPGASKSGPLTTTAGTTVFGSLTDNWGLTGAQVANTAFGILLANYHPAGSPPGTFSANIGSTLIEVSYGINNSDNLIARSFNFAVPNVNLVGIEIGITALETVTGGTLTAQLTFNDIPIGTPQVFPGFPYSAFTRFVLGSRVDMWGTQLTAVQVNSTEFGVAISVSGPGTFQVETVDATILQVGSDQNFDWIKTYQQTDGSVNTLALDSTGALWSEDVLNNPGVMTEVASAISPNAFGKSVTLDDVEYIALSDLQQGLDIPRQWNGSSLQRVSQVGPGAPPSVLSTPQTGVTQYPIVASPNGITQPPAQSDPASPGTLHTVLWSAGPGTGQTGNVITVYYATTTSDPVQDPNLIPGNAIVLAGLPTFLSQDPNGTYIINSIGSAVPPFPGGSAVCWYFTVTAPTQNSDIKGPHVAGTYQCSIATLTTTNPLPNTQIGSNLITSGVTIPAWDGTWNVLATPNAAQLTITSTELTGNVATYTYNLVTGVAPVAGQQVTINGCINGPIVGGTSLFNITNGILTSAGAGTFTISINGPNIPNQAEASATATVNGTIFQFDPGISLVGSVTSPIFGNSGGGFVVIAGQGLAAGVRQAVVMFLTDTGALTGCSIPVSFSTNTGATSIVFTNIPTGPSNVIARYIAITGANGDQFYYIPVPVTILTGGQNVTYSATVINDNTTTQATFTFTDQVLLAATEIDVQGNNLFEQKELQPCIGMIAYAARLFAWGEQNQNNQFINMTFDGGAQQNIVGTPFPLGWTPDPSLYTGGSLTQSPIFGSAYYIVNATGAHQDALGLITQNAYQDAYNVPIIEINTTYSVRVSARCPGGAPSGGLVVDLYSPSLAREISPAFIPLTSMTDSFAVFETALLGNPLTIAIPNDLQLRVYLSASDDGADVQIDRVAIFPTKQPYLSTQLTVSYVNNFEAFDQVTGVVDSATENQQPIRSCFTQYGNLYMVKSGSLLETTDNGSTEPNQWKIRTVSNSVGTPSVNGVDYVDSDQQGESYALIAGRAGLYLFNGGEPALLSGDIRSLWNTINWTYGYTLWARNDTVNRRIMVGVPLPTPNQWMPNAPSNPNPTTPNVILMMSYREILTTSELIDRATVRASTFSGKLIATDISRKWTIWQIQAPYADFVKRQDTTWPLMLGNSNMNGKIFQLTEGYFYDDGAAINESYVTSPFVSTDLAQQLQLGNTRKAYNYMTMVLSGNGRCHIKQYPENLNTVFATEIVPFDLSTAPNTVTGSGSFDLETPMNETANRLFLEFSMNPTSGADATGTGFNLSRIVMAMSQDVMTPVRGRN